MLCVGFHALQGLDVFIGYVALLLWYQNRPCVTEQGVRVNLYIFQSVSTASISCKAGHRRMSAARAAHR
jgi:hypothetical protein